MARAGVTLPPARSKNHIKKCLEPGTRVSDVAGVYLAAVGNFLAAELFDTIIKYSEDGTIRVGPKAPFKGQTVKTITPAHIGQVMQADEEFRVLYSKLGMIIEEAGVLPMSEGEYRHRIAYRPSKKKKKPNTDEKKGAEEEKAEKGKKKKKNRKAKKSVKFAPSSGEDAEEHNGDSDEEEGAYKEPPEDEEDLEHESEPEVEEEEEQPKPKKKRGRKPKEKKQKETGSEKESAAVDSAAAEEALQPPKKRGRKKKNT